MACVLIHSGTKKVKRVNTTKVELLNLINCQWHRAVAWKGVGDTDTFFFALKVEKCHRKSLAIEEKALPLIVPLATECCSICARSTLQTSICPRKLLANFRTHTPTLIIYKKFESRISLLVSDCSRLLHTGLWHTAQCRTIIYQNWAEYIWNTVASFFVKNSCRTYSNCF